MEAGAVEQHTAAVRCQDPRARAGEIRGPARRLFGLPIELNCAGARTLESLKGIGSVRASRIVEERARRRYQREELERKSGSPVTHAQPMVNECSTGDRRSVNQLQLQLH